MKRKGLYYIDFNRNGQNEILLDEHAENNSKNPLQKILDEHKLQNSKSEKRCSTRHNNLLSEKRRKMGS